MCTFLVVKMPARFRIPAGKMRSTAKCLHLLGNMPLSQIMSLGFVMPLGWTQPNFSALTVFAYASAE